MYFDHFLVILSLNDHFLLVWVKPKLDTIHTRLIFMGGPAEQNTGKPIKTNFPQTVLFMTVEIGNSCDSRCLFGVTTFTQALLFLLDLYSCSLLIKVN